MKLIFGFGNPGTQYNFTRHNFGFLALDFYAKVHGLAWQSEPRFFAEVCEDPAAGLLLIKPQTFYNDVGRCVRAVCDFYKVKPQDILIVCDDFNLEFGKIRYRERGSAGGNNGLKSVIDHFTTDDFPRLRLGTSNDGLRQRIGDTEFVLGKFTPAERGQLPQILSEFVKNVTKY